MNGGIRGGGERENTIVAGCSTVVAGVLFDCRRAIFDCRKRCFGLLQNLYALQDLNRENARKCTK